MSDMIFVYNSYQPDADHALQKAVEEYCKFRRMVPNDTVQSKIRKVEVSSEEFGRPQYHITVHVVGMKPDSETEGASEPSSIHLPQQADQNNREAIF